MDDLTRIRDAARLTADSYGANGNPFSDMISEAFAKFAEFLDDQRRQKDLAEDMERHQNG